MTNCDDCGGLEGVTVHQLCLDYIWYSSESLRVTGVLETPPVETITQHYALPSQLFPSDHIPLLAEFQFTPITINGSYCSPIEWSVSRKLPVFQNQIKTQRQKSQSNQRRLWTSSTYWLIPLNLAPLVLCVSLGFTVIKCGRLRCRHLQACVQANDGHLSNCCNNVNIHSAIRHERFQFFSHTIQFLSIFCNF